MNVNNLLNVCPVVYVRTLLVPLYRVQIDSSISTLSPNEYGKGGPLAMADATADLRKSILVAQYKEAECSSRIWKTNVEVKLHRTCLGTNLVGRFQVMCVVR